MQAQRPVAKGLRSMTAANATRRRATAAADRTDLKRDRELDQLSITGTSGAYRIPPQAHPASALAKHMYRNPSPRRRLEVARERGRNAILCVCTQCVPPCYILPPSCGVAHSLIASQPREIMLD